MDSSPCLSNWAAVKAAQGRGRTGFTAHAFHGFTTIKSEVALTGLRKSGALGILVIAFSSALAQRFSIEVVARRAAQLRQSSFAKHLAGTTAFSKFEAVTSLVLAAFVHDARSIRVPLIVGLVEAALHGEVDVGR